MLGVYFYNIIAFNVRERSRGFLRTLRSLCSFLPWSAVVFVGCFCKSGP